MKNFLAWVKQPTTMTALAVLVGAAVYWFTSNAELAAGAVVAILGSMNDTTKDLLPKVEALEASVKAAGVSPPAQK